MDITKEGLEEALYDSLEEYMDNEVLNYAS